MHLLALSGSLRAASLNTMALRALQKLAPESVAIRLYESVGALPHFNTDVEMSALPEIVAEMRRQVAAAGGIAGIRPSMRRASHILITRHVSCPSHVMAGLDPAIHV
ncbi:NADPH-dependent FMN reductase [Microvirga calopogonii]|uniref:NADPH-dependent FMN reductase n=1 Tax=Microvirga calopogonii TaxID=2078013 RepID=UPI001FE11AB1|nr:NAD(P)H-dependent oxidoreductase [Microvirga calopogonii]